MRFWNFCLSLCPSCLTGIPALSCFFALLWWPVMVSHIPLTVLWFHPLPQQKHWIESFIIRQPPIQYHPKYSQHSWGDCIFRSTFEKSVFKARSHLLFKVLSVDSGALEALLKEMFLSKPTYCQGVDRHGHCASVWKGTRLTYTSSKNCE